MTRNFKLIKGTEVKTVSVAAGPFDGGGWRLLCHLDEPGRKCSLFTRKELGITKYCLVDERDSSQEDVKKQYEYMVDVLGAIADLSFSEAFGHGATLFKAMTLARKAEELKRQAEKLRKVK